MRSTQLTESYVEEAALGVIWEALANPHPLRAYRPVGPEATLSLKKERGELKFAELQL